MMMAAARGTAMVIKAVLIPMASVVRYQVLIINVSLKYKTGPRKIEMDRALSQNAHMIHNRDPLCGGLIILGSLSALNAAVAPNSPPHTMQ